MVTRTVVPPANWIGTQPEWSIFNALNQLGIEFEYQSAMLGGRLERGGAVLDFYLPDRNLGINVMSYYWHYSRPDTLANDLLQRTALEGQGITVIYIDEQDALKNPRYFVEQALLGFDHSRMGTV